MRPIGHQPAYLKRFTIIKSAASGSHTDCSTYQFSILRGTYTEFSYSDRFMVTMHLLNQLISLPEVKWYHL